MKKAIVATALTGVMALGVGATSAPAAQAAPTLGPASTASTASTGLGTGLGQASGLSTLVLAQPAQRPAPVAAVPGRIKANPAAALIGYAVYLIVRFGIPWLVRYASDVLTKVMASQFIRTQVCRELRKKHNGWGWSSYCRGT